ncbi:uncharacterized protein [Oscarella lobularis]|uniref:uncharacterized protein isoform X2 n=1 Tax=Oscarella lobularis TaxID=121494 RepID=UPI0033135E68
MCKIALLLVCCLGAASAAAQDPKESGDGSTTENLDLPRSFVACYHMTKKFKGSNKCPVYSRSKLLYQTHLNDVQEFINSTKVLGSVYPNNVKCVWTFYIKPGERAAIGCPTLELDTYSGDCGAGVCSRSVVDTKHRDYLQIVGEVKKDRCVGKSSCNECMTMTKSASSSSSSSCKKEKDNYVTFCGNWSSSKMSKPRADISYEETKGGKIKVVFWSDELRQGKGFFCKYVNLNRPFNSKHVSPRSIGSGVPNPCVLKRRQDVIEKWLSAANENKISRVDYLKRDCGGKRWF